VVSVFRKKGALKLVQHRFENGMFLRERIPQTSLGSILFVHGLGESGLCFEDLLERPELAGHHLLVPDLPGYGRSPWCEVAALSLEEHVDHLAAWLIRRETGPVVVVGHSMGGVLALLLAERYPQLVAFLVDVDGNKSVADCLFSSQAARFRLQAFVDFGFDELREKIFQQGIKDIAQRGYYVSLRLSDARAYHRNSLDLVELSETDELARRLADLTIPAAYIAGVPDGASSRSRDLLREAGVPLHEISPSGHWPFIDQVDGFVTLLGHLLDDFHNNRQAG
jgi:pimeloyl-ACP methyl ester carboxylesterase